MSSERPHVLGLSAAPAPSRLCLSLSCRRLARMVMPVEKLASGVLAPTELLTAEREKEPVVV